MSERKAGRELDAEVAERVMGWRVERQRGNSPWLVKRPDHEWSRIEQHAFSTDIAAAWQVVEKMQADGWGHKHLTHSQYAESPSVEWTFMQPGKGIRSIVKAEAMTAPLAICLAALATTQTEEREG